MPVNLEIMNSQNNQKEIIILASVSLFCATLILCFFLFSQKEIYIKSAENFSMDGKMLNTISVEGEGKAYANPDMVSINLTLRDTEKNF